MTAEAGHEFDALNTLLIASVLIICVLVAYVIKINSFYYLPESAAAILMGAVVGGIVRLCYPAVEEMHILSFRSEFFFFILLPPIIFEAAYSLSKKDFFSNIWSISLYAVLGTLISTFLIGYSVYFLGIIRLADIDTTSPIESLIFGSLVSSIDPVATLSILGNPELHCDPLLYSLLFGESVLNDAVAISLFKTFVDFHYADTAFTPFSIVDILVRFVMVSFCSLLLGVALGFCCCYICKYSLIRKYPEYEISLLLLFSFGSYALSEAMQLSGIMTLFFNGVVLSHYNIHNLSSISQVTSHNIIKSFAVLSDFFVYVFIGMNIFTKSFQQYNILFAFLCLFLCVSARFFNIFPCSFFSNFFRTRKIPVKMQVVMWFSGLRGAISFALAMQTPGTHRDLYVSTTLILAIFTTLVLGGLTHPLLTSMGMRSEHSSSQNNANGHVNYYELTSGIDETKADSVASYLTAMEEKESDILVNSVGLSSFDRLQRNYLFPLFGGPSAGLLDRDNPNSDFEEERAPLKYMVRISDDTSAGADVKLNHA